MADATERTTAGGEHPDPEELGFAGAMAELERIVAELESDTLDVDLLADRVERAAVLVGWCRDRIDGTRFRVEEILERLDPDATDPD
ncbi:exodeoxyribonuclease VII small subunit [Dermatobacter hominis]|uniref:exodeoxyribonuclease VII small subunit n=1 Tax=Dermatobacter hominis TaxID=2884263 RepID=UPI001D0FFD51|nr:exodeoxyribonuclease VII small subunit [Dermatobacter hominis]UDY34196.1 exodeoxyribonuclease VII small subunit [Dermatobacter hominis]